MSITTKIHASSKLVIAVHPSLRVSAFIAIDSLRRGPALGGTRVRVYPDGDAAANEALALAGAMSRKSALAQLNLGGGKGVLRVEDPEFVSNPNHPDRPEVFRWYGMQVDQCGGTYITTEDSGTHPGDMVHIRKTTPYVVGLPLDQGGSGDPSPFTSEGVVRGMMAIAEIRLNKPFHKVKVAVQGVGHVGSHVVAQLLALGADVTVCDVTQDRAKQALEHLAVEGVDTSRVKVVDAKQITAVKADVFSPNGFGGTITTGFAAQCPFQIVAGAANNQLASVEAGEMLYDRGIFYCPDYAINAGGLVSVGGEYYGWSAEQVGTHVARIGETVRRLAVVEANTGVPAFKVADAAADDLISQGTASTLDQLSWRGGPRHKVNADMFTFDVSS